MTDFSQSFGAYSTSKSMTMSPALVSRRTDMAAKGRNVGFQEGSASRNLIFAHRSGSSKQKRGGDYVQIAIEIELRRWLLFNPLVSSSKLRRQITYLSQATGAAVAIRCGNKWGAV